MNNFDLILTIGRHTKSRMENLCLLCSFTCQLLQTRATKMALSRPLLNFARKFSTSSIRSSGAHGDHGMSSLISIPFCQTHFRTFQELNNGSLEHTLLLSPSLSWQPCTTLLWNMSILTDQSLLNMNT